MIVPIFFILLPSIIEGVIFNVTYVIECEIHPNQPFEYEMELIEKDYAGDDSLAKVKRCAKAGEKSTGTMIARVESGDEFLSSEYDLRMKIFHTCKSRDVGDDMQLDWVYVGKCSVKADYCRFEKYLSL